MKNLILIILLNIFAIPHTFALDQTDSNEAKDMDNFLERLDKDDEVKIETRNKTIDQMVKYCGTIDTQNVVYADCLGRVSEFIQQDLNKRVAEIASKLRNESIKFSQDFEHNNKLWLNYANQECGTLSDLLYGGSGTVIASLKCDIATKKNYLNILDLY